MTNDDFRVFRTVAHYRIAYTDYFKPQLGAPRMEKINRTHIKAFVG